LESFDIEQVKTRTEIIRQTVAQVLKDFSMFGIDIHFSGNPEMAYPELFDQLMVQIERLLEQDHSRLTALLYQIDLPENRVYEATLEHPDWSLQAVITELVIHRELKKVLIRNYIKNQKKGT
jgi:hypothetical protein